MMDSDSGVSPYGINPCPQRYLSPDRVWNGPAMNTPEREVEGHGLGKQAFLPPRSPAYSPRSPSFPNHHMSVLGVLAMSLDRNESKAVVGAEFCDRIALHIFPEKGKLRFDIKINPLFPNSNSCQPLFPWRTRHRGKYKYGIHDRQRDICSLAVTINIQYRVP